MNGLDLFSGIGGLSLALNPWVRTVAYCEIDAYARAVLHAHVRDGKLDNAPIHGDVRTLTAADIAEPVDIIFGGFPCQDISLAGKRAGLDGQRSGLYREVIRLVGELRPTFVFLENVAAIRGHAWRVVEDLARLGFDCRWTNLSAAEVGAPHRRDRWWLLAAHPVRVQLWIESGRGGGPHGQGEAVAIDDGRETSLADTNGEPSRQCHAGWTSKTEGESGLHCAEGVVAPLADANGARLEERGQQPPRQELKAAKRSCISRDYWSIEPDVGRVAYGVPSRVDRLKCLGNAVVPAQAREAFKRLMGY